MNFSDTDKKRLKKFYDNLLKKNGKNNPQSLSWNNSYTQTIRFDILSQISNLENKSILDVGCGFGDFYNFLKSKYQNFEYTGIDIFSDFIKIARKNYPNLHFIESDFYSYECEKFDFIFASGSLSFKVNESLVGG